MFIDVNEAMMGLGEFGAVAVQSRALRQRRVTRGAARAIALRDARICQCVNRAYQRSLANGGANRRFLATGVEACYAAHGR
jgi:hypothetical protein